MAACALSAGMREKEYLEIAKRYTREQLDQFAHALGALTMEMETYPFEDRLGIYYQEIAAKSSRDFRGEFYSPTELNRLIARMIIDVDQIIADGKPITVQEPASGAGGMILAAAELFAPKAEGQPSHVDLLRVTATDVSPVACDMTTINTTMWGVPTMVIWGDTIRLTANAVYPNVHYIRTGQLEIDKVRRMFATLDDLTKPKHDEPALTLPEDLSQMELFAEEYNEAWQQDVPRNPFKETTKPLPQVEPEQLELFDDL